MRERRGAQRVGKGVGVTLAFAALVLAAVFALFSVQTYDTLGAVFVAPVLILISVPILARQARREGDPTLLWLLVGALLLKLAGAIARHFVAFDVYGGQADAASYDAVGRGIAESFRGGVFDTGLPNLAGSNFIRFLTGSIYAVIGPTLLGGFLVYSWLGFWGLFFFYRAFRIAVPEGAPRGYARLVFFLPSLVYWPSSIGKEAWMIFALGLAAYGAARMLSGSTARGLLWAATGLWLVGIVRPHVAGMAGLALLGGYVLKRPSPQLKLLAPIAKGIIVAGLVVAAAFLVVRTDEFLKETSIGADGSVASTLEGVAERTGQGGSQFAPSILQSPLRAPVAAVTVLYRPLLFEAHNDQAFLTALETSFLLLLTLVRLPWAWAAIKSIRRQPYIAFCAAYAGLFIIGFSSIANFGLLARERVQLLPLFLVFLCVPPAAKRDEEESRKVEYAHAGS